MALESFLATYSLSPAEYTVLFHVADSLVVSRAALGDWVSRQLPRVVDGDLSLAACDRAVESLIARALLVELTQAEIDADAVRWRGESLAVSFGATSERCAGDVDVTEDGFRILERINAAQHGGPLAPRSGYDDRCPGVVRVLGETEAACRRQVDAVLAGLHDAPWRWPPGSTVEPMRRCGPWWHARHERVDDGFEMVLRRAPA